MIEYRNAVSRHRRAAMRFFLVVMAAVVLLNVFQSRTYRSEGKLLVRLGRKTLLAGMALKVLE